MTRPDTKQFLLKYDNGSRVTRVTDWKGRFTTYDYDEVGNLKKVTDPLLRVEQYNYDAVDNLFEFINARNKKTTIYRTARGEVSSLLFPDGQTRSYQYDPNGNQWQFNNGMTTTTYTYDADDQLTKIDYPMLTDTTFTYYKDGRTESMTDSQGVTTWFYDANGRTTTLNTPQGNLSYLYDSWGRRTQLGQSGTNKILYSYTADKLTGILKQPENKNTVLHYDA